MVIKWLLLALSVGSAECKWFAGTDEELLAGVSEADVAPLNEAVAGTCSDVKLAACQARFNEDLGIKGNVDFSNPSGLSNALLSIFEQQGPEGFKKICRARVDFEQCLGASYAACLDYRFYISKGFAIGDAIYYPSQFRSLKFQCSAGAGAILRNYACDVSTILSSAYSLRRCAAAFNAAPANSKCSAAAAYAKCVWTPYSQCSRDLGWQACEATRVGFTTWLPYCDLYCDAQKGPVQGTLLGHHNEAEKTASLGSPPLAAGQKETLDHPLKDFDFYGKKASPKEL